MIKLLQSLVDIVITFINLVINTFNALINLITSFPEYISFTVSSLNLLPEVLITFALATISISVIYFFINRNPG